MKSVFALAGVAFVCAWFVASPATAETVPPNVRHAVVSTIQPLMAKDGIAGMAVGVVVDGRPFVLNFGVASKATKQPVGDATLFEIGSISKTFTATLASYAQLGGELSLSDNVEKYDPALQGTAFGRLSLLNLGTHTSGGLPLQVPDDVNDMAQLTAYLKMWQPPHAPGTYRTYSNVSIGMLGVLVAAAMHADFTTVMQERILAGLGLHDTYLNVPPARMADYAQGYKDDDSPIRMKGGVLDAEAYGIRTTASDLVRYLEANMGIVDVEPKLQRALEGTHTGYFTAPPMTQDLIWEQYSYPVTLDTLLAGNSTRMLFESTPATAIEPPQKPLAAAWLNKTGSTNGFGAYVAFVPSEKMGIVLLANKSYPIPDRVKAAYAILSALSATPSGRP